MNIEEMAKQIELLVKDDEKSQEAIIKQGQEIERLKEENKKLKEQITEYQDEIFARDNNWYDMQD